MEMSTLIVAIVAVLATIIVGVMSLIGILIGAFWALFSLYMNSRFTTVDKELTALKSAHKEFEKESRRDDDVGRADLGLEKQMRVNQTSELHARIDSEKDRVSDVAQRVSEIEGIHIDHK